MSTVNFFLAQLSAGQIATGQNGSGIAGEPGALNSEGSFDFFQTLLSGTVGGEHILSNDKKTIKNVFTQLPLQKPGVDIKALSEQLDALKNQIIAKQSDFIGDADAAFTRLNIQDQISTLKTQILNAQQDEGDIPLSALILSGLNPLQTSNIQSRISEIETKLGRELTIEDIIAGVGGIIDFDSKSDIFGTGQVIISSLKEAISSNDETTKPNDALPIVAETQTIKHSDSGFVIEDTSTPTDKPTLVDGNIQDKGDGPTNQAEDLSAFLAALLPPIFQSQPIPAHYEGMNAREAINARIGKLIAAAKLGQGVKGDIGAQGVKNAQNALLSGGAQNVNGGSFFNLQDGFFIGDNGMLFIDGEPSGINLSSGIPFTTTNQAAHGIAQSAQTAGQPHPATEMVSARLLQAAKGSQNQTFLLQLEPADLGKIEVRLEFGADKIIKAIMNVEKPETFLMLQRDAHALERSLQDNGLELDGGNIDMQLAEQGFSFDQDNNGKGGGEKYGGNQADSNGEIEMSEEILESTMTWQVDANSGHVHYNIMA